MSYALDIKKVCELDTNYSCLDYVMYYDILTNTSIKADVIRYALLINDSANHNKFYELYETIDSVVAKYGRIGNKHSLKVYDRNSRQFDKKLTEKFDKGYILYDNISIYLSKAKKIHALIE